MRRILICLLVVLAGCHHRERPSVAFVSPHLQNDPYAFQKAAGAFEDNMQVDLYPPETSVKELSKHKLVIFESMGARLSLIQPQIDSLKAVTKVLFLETPLAQGNVSYPEITPYWTNGNEDNYRGMLSYIAANVFHLPVKVQKPIIYPEHGFYYPGRDSLFANANSYLRWYDSSHSKTNLTVGLVFYQSSYVKKDLAPVDALIRSVEAHGAKPVTLLAKGAFPLDSLKGIVDVIIYGGMFLDFSHPEKGRALADSLGVPLLGAITHYYKDTATWAKDPGGFAPDLSERFFFSERDGVIEPVNIAGTENGVGVPIPYQINWRVERALSWARLRYTPNAEKKLVCTYYSEGGGKADVGADIDAYLDVPGTLSRLLKTFQQEGYNVGKQPLPDAPELARRMSVHASNAAEGKEDELKERMHNGEIVTIPEDEYLQWFHSYPAEQQQQVTDKWGPPPGNLMTITDSSGKKRIVIPVLRYGNITLAPHPSWGLQDNHSLIYATNALPPNHAYIAFYEWMKRVEQPAVFLSLFTQLSLMPGKDEGPSAHDFVGELIGNIPHITLSPLIAGAGPGNKRRANALTIGYVTDISLAGLSDSLKALSRLADDWASATNPVLKDQLEQKVLKLAASQHIGKEEAATIPELRNYLQKIAKEHIPNGGHILAGTEISYLLKALNGQYIPAGPGDDPTRNPDALPAGRNTYGVNTQGVPTPEAWELGKKMADELLQQYAAKHGTYPHKVGFVLWSAEITHNQGVTEAEIMYLMGVKPVWNNRGQVMDVQLIDKRPRIDVLITTSGTYRDHFGDKIKLLDKAIQLAAAAPDSNNWVRLHTLQYMRQLHSDSFSTAALRIFSSDQGAYSTNLEFAGLKDWNSDTALSDLYMSRMAHAYGQKVNAAYQRELFTLNVKDIEAAAFSRTSNVYGIMDHPMVAAYFGAYNLAVKNTTGKQPDLYINDLQADGEVASLSSFFHKEMRSRYLNPAWIKGMMAHGYDGARYMQAFSENLFLWDVTTPDLVKDADWNDVYETYIEDRQHLGLPKYFEQQNPYARQEVVKNMLKAAAKGYWHASATQLKKLQGMAPGEGGKTALSGQLIEERVSTLPTTRQRPLSWILIPLLVLFFAGWFKKD